MKKLLCLLLALALLPGCMPQGLARNEKTVQFYYVSDNPDYFSPLGILGPETRTLRPSEDSVEGLLERYLGGNMSPELSDPFDEPMRLIRAQEVSQREITLVFDDALANLTGIKLQLFCACVARTLADYGGYETVNFRAEHLMLDGDRESVTVRPDELVLEDHSAGQANAVVLLYFSDADGRYLIGEQCAVTAEDTANMPEFIVRRLIEGPQSESLRPTIPAGTMLPYVVSVVDGVCVVNFSDEFRTNRPQTALGERMTVFSVVNSLAQLDEVDAVDIMIQGRRVERYVHLDLSAELEPDERMIGPVRGGVGEFDATLYVCLEGEERLAAFPMPARTLTDVLKELCGFQERNGYYSPARDLVTAYAVHEADGVVSVTLETAEADDAQMRMLTRSVIVTMSELPEVETLRLYVNGEEYDQSADPYSDDWILP